MGRYRSIKVALVLALGLGGGCWMSVEDHCAGCTIVRDRAAVLPPIPPRTRAVVVLVHGAFGFGDEWKPVVDVLRAKPRVDFVVFSWGGPWTREPTLPAEALRRLVQQAIDEAPRGCQVLVIAHSAGGALARYVGQRLRVPAGRRVRIASIAGADINVAAYHPEREPDTPLGVAVGGEQAPLGPIAPGVDYTEYANAAAPSTPRPSSDGIRHVWLGAGVSHNGSVAVAALPLVRAL